MAKSVRVLGAAGLILALASGPAQAEWITSWATAPLPANAGPPPGAAPGAAPAGSPYSNRTLRQILRLSAGGSAVRVRFSNAYGSAPLNVGGARIALLDANGAEVAGSSRVLTFGGAKSAVAAKSAPLLSDPVALKLPPLAKVAVSLYLPGEVGACSCHQVGLDELQVSAEGDFTAAAFTPEKTLNNRAFLASVEVDAPKGAATVAMMGDSITDGVGSTAKANKRWPDQLADRLAKKGGNVWGVANLGISGNRVLGDGAGESALARLDRDIFALPGVKAIILFEGVNDLGLSFGPPRPPRPGAPAPATPPVSNKISAAQMIAGYRQIIDRAHQLGIKVYGATIAPYKGASYWSAEGEAARTEINTFIRSSGAFDAVFDFDKAFGDPADPAQIKTGFHMGDHLHGTDAGYKAVADSIDLRLFR